MKIIINTRELETACGVLTEQGRILSSFIDEIACILSNCFASEDYIDLPDGLRFQNQPPNNYKLTCDADNICITKNRKTLRELRYFCRLLHDRWLDRLVGQIDSSASELKIPMNLDKIPESFAD